MKFLQSSILLAVVATAIWSAVTDGATIGLEDDDDELVRKRDDEKDDDNDDELRSRIILDVYVKKRRRGKPGH